MGREGEKARRRWGDGVMRLDFEGKKQKNAEKLHFFAEKFGHIKKKQYLCTRFRKEV